MMNEQYPQVSAKELEETVSGYHRRELFLAGVILLGTGLLILYWFQRFAGSIPILGGCLFCWTAFLAFLQIEAPAGVPIDQVPPEKLGHYTPEQLHEIVAKICKSYGEPEIPNIYLVESAEAAAFVINVDILNFVRPWNAVYIGSYPLHALDREELEAMICHEMCHFSLHVTFWNRYFYFQPFIFAAWTTFVMSYPVEWLWSKTGGGAKFWLLFLLLALVGIVGFLWSVATFVARVVTSLSYRPDSKEIESLCDFEAGRRVGLLPTINWLLKFGSRQEIFSLLFARLSPDESDPLRLPGHEHTQDGEEPIVNRYHPAYLRAKERLLEEHGGEDAPKDLEFSEEQILEAMLHDRAEALSNAYDYLSEHLPVGFITLEESLPLIEEAIIETGADSFDHAPRELMRWLEHDNCIPNVRIDEEEYEDFIEALRVNHHRPLFYIPVEFDPDLASESTHPPLRKRILFLEHNRTLDLLSLEGAVD